MRSRWDHRFALGVVWRLVLGPTVDHDVLLAFNLIAANEASLMQLSQHHVDIDRISWEDFHLDLLGPVLQAPFPVGNGPQASEQQARLKGQLHQLRIGEKAWLDVSRTRHSTPLPRQPAACSDAVNLEAGAGC